MDDKVFASVCKWPKTTHTQGMNSSSTQATAVEITDGQTTYSEMKMKKADTRRTLSKVYIIEREKVTPSTTRTKGGTEQQPIVKILDSRFLHSQLPLQVSKQSLQISGLAETVFQAKTVFWKKFYT